MTTIRKGESVHIKPEWQDPGDSKFHWIALTDEEKGRVTIGPLGTGMIKVPIYVVRSEMIERPTP